MCVCLSKLHALFTVYIRSRLDPSRNNRREKVEVLCRAPVFIGNHIHIHASEDLTLRICVLVYCAMPYNMVETTMKLRCDLKIGDKRGIEAKNLTALFFALLKPK